MTNSSPSVERRRALEALRNGVPNRDAVRALGCSQAEAERRLIEQLDQLAATREEQVPGLLVSGGFGTGKSHLLEYLQHLALERNFVCSKIVISKETPLHDPGKVFKAAIESAVVPGRTGQAIAEIALKLRPDSNSYADFWKWANRDDSGISPLFQATLFIHERLKSDVELVEKIINFWSGERLGIADVRQGLAQCGESVSYTVKAVPARQLALERILFVARLIQGAGYAGWVILIDEVELIGRYSLLQRGKSYAELARWMGRLEGEAIPGITSVAAITDDFALAVLQEKGDRDYVGPRLRSKGTDDAALLAGRAERGMRIIENDACKLDPPDDSILNETYKRLKTVHGEAYDWVPPDVSGGSLAIRRAMRSYVRRWINEWDLMRLYANAQVATEEQELHPTYVEDEALQLAPEQAEPNGDESTSE